VGARGVLLELELSVPVAFLGNFRHKLIVRLGRGNGSGYVLLGKSQKPLALLFGLGDSTRKQLLTFALPAQESSCAVFYEASLSLAQPCYIWWHKIFT